MDQEWMMVKEEAILFARDRLEDAQDALSETMPEASEEVGYLREELAKELMRVRGEMLALCANAYFSEELA